MEPPSYYIMSTLECRHDGASGTGLSIQWGLPDKAEGVVEVGRTSIITADKDLPRPPRTYPVYADAVKKWNATHRAPKTPVVPASDPAPKKSSSRSSGTTPTIGT